jgi:hypothetical protein
LLHDLIHRHITFCGNLTFCHSANTIQNSGLRQKWYQNYEDENTIN